MKLDKDVCFSLYIQNRNRVYPQLMMVLIIMVAFHHLTSIAIIIMTQSLTNFDSYFIGDIFVYSAVADAILCRLFRLCVSNVQIPATLRVHQ